MQILKSQSLQLLFCHLFLSQGNLIFKMVF